PLSLVDSRLAGTALRGSGLTSFAGASVVKSIGGRSHLPKPCRATDKSRNWRSWNGAAASPRLRSFDHASHFAPSTRHARPLRVDDRPRLHVAVGCLWPR